MTDWTQCKPTVICLSENKKQKQLVESKMLLHMRFKGQRNFSTPSRGFSCSLLCSLSIYQTSLNFPEENTIIFRFINNKSNCFKLSTPSYNDQKEKKKINIIRMNCHLLFIFTGDDHFDLGHEVNTAAKWQTWCFCLKADERGDNTSSNEVIISNQAWRRKIRKMANMSTAEQQKNLTSCQSCTRFGFH